jgi:hypothetical protein
VIENPIPGSASPKSFDWPAVGVTVMACAPTVVLSDAVEFAYAVDDVGVNVADNDAAPRAVGTQSHVAVVDTAATAPQPEMVVPPNMKFTVPARDVVAVMRLVTPYCGDEEANAKLTAVEAYPIATVKFDVVAVALFASVTLTDTVEDPATAGVPEMVPVEVAKLRPLTKVPVKAYVSAVRPPDPAITNENALFAVPDKPVVGVAIESSPATVNATAEDVVDTATFPLKVLVTLTLNAPASVVATGLMV